MSIGEILKGGIKAAVEEHYRLEREMAEKMSKVPMPHFMEAAAKSPAFAKKIDLPPKAQMPEFKTRKEPVITGGGKTSWARIPGVK